MDAPVHPIESKKGVKECEEVIAALDALASEIGAALADGKLSMIEMVSMLMRLSAPLKEALEGAIQVKDELKDLDKDEAALLFGEMFMALQKFAAIFSK